MNVRSGRKPQSSNPTLPQTPRRKNEGCGARATDQIEQSLGEVLMHLPAAQPE